MKGRADRRLSLSFPAGVDRKGIHDAEDVVDPLPSLTLGLRMTT
jgi:hypothetical protein